MSTPSSDAQLHDLPGGEQGHLRSDMEAREGGAEAAGAEGNEQESIAISGLRLVVGTSCGGEGGCEGRGDSGSEGSGEGGESREETRVEGWR